MTTRPSVSQFPGQGCMDDLTTEKSFDSLATWVNDVLGLYFRILSMRICTTSHWQTSGRLLQELNACTVGCNGSHEPVCPRWLLSLKGLQDDQTAPTAAVLSSSPIWRVPFWNSFMTSVKQFFSLFYVQLSEYSEIWKFFHYFRRNRSYFSLCHGKWKMIKLPSPHGLRRKKLQTGAVSNFLSLHVTCRLRRCHLHGLTSGPHWIFGSHVNGFAQV